jgi:L-fucose isomerase-like protein
LLPIARTTFDIELADEIFAHVQTELKTAGFNLIGPSSLITHVDDLDQSLRTLSAAPPDLILILQTTFADSSMVLRVAKDLQPPLLLWAIPEEHSGGRLRLNSLCGVNLAAHALKRARVQYETVYAQPGDPEVLHVVRTLALAGRTRRILQTAKIGRVGDHPDGLDTCKFDPDRIKQSFGVEIVQADLDPIFQATREADQGNVEDIYANLTTKVDEIDTLDPQATQKSIASYLTLRQLSQDEGLDGLAVRCWPEFFTELGCAACGAMSMLSDELIPCSCEADVNGTLTQMILQTLSESPAFGTDMVSLDEERDALVLWHCGLAPLSMADPESPKRGTIHSNRKLPLLFDFTLKPGPVTLARLSEAFGEYKLVVGHGEMIRGPKSFSGTSGLLRFDRPAKEVLDVILTQGLEHHISITYGDFTAALTAFAKLLSIPILSLTT